MKTNDEHIRGEYINLSDTVQARNAKPRKHGALDLLRGN